MKKNGTIMIFNIIYIITLLCIYSMIIFIHSLMEVSANEMPTSPKILFYVELFVTFVVALVPLVFANLAFKYQNNKYAILSFLSFLCLIITVIILL